MNIGVRRGAGDGATVTGMILGQNIEMVLGTPSGLLSDRLRNPKFVGPPNRMTGLAPEWEGASCARVACELTPEAGLLGAEAQMLRQLRPFNTPCLHQNRIQVRAGEVLELELWARAWHEPVTLDIALLPLSSRAGKYDSGDLTIDAPYYKRYTLPLKAPRDDNEARLCLQFKDTGELWLDQIHLRPEGEPLLSKGVMDAMAAMRIPTLRYPGGVVSNAYNWRHAIGPAHLRKAGLDATFHQGWPLSYDFGLDEYLQCCLAQGIVPALTFNIATGTPDEAAEWAAYCAAWFRKAGVEPPPIHWHVGNHPYRTTTAHMTAAMYAGVLRTFVPPVKAAYPNSRIVAVMGWEELDAPPEKCVWRETLMAEAADLIDLIQVQTYGLCNPEAEPEAQVATLARKLDSIEPALRAFIALCRSRGLRWNVGIAEWNWWLQASHWDGRGFDEPPTVLHGLFIAGMLRRFALLAPDFEAAYFYNLVNCMGILNHRGADIEVTDAVEIFKLYRPAFPGRLVPLELAGGAEGSAGGPVEALGLENEAGTWLFLSNRSHRETAQVALGGFAAGQAVCAGFIGTAPTGTFTREPEVARPVGKTVEIPPLSILRLRWDMRGLL